MEGAGSNEKDVIGPDRAVLGGDGYCGWATALYLSSKGHSVSIIDNFARRQWDHEVGAQTLTPIRPLAERLRVWQELTGEKKPADPRKAAAEEEAKRKKAEADALAAKPKVVVDVYRGDKHVQESFR